MSEQQQMTLPISEHVWSIIDSIESCEEYFEDGRLVQKKRFELRCRKADD